MTRATHDLTDRHHGVRLATTIALETIIRDIPAGTTLEQAIREIDHRLTMMENGGGRMYGDMTAEAVMFKNIPKSFKADSRIKAKQTASFTADAIYLYGGRVMANAVMKANQQKTFTANAKIEIRGSFIANAVKKKKRFQAFFCDAVIA
jgi:hypothetical protein